MRVSVFGLGYVGAVSCACLPELGHEIIGVDTHPGKVAQISAGRSPVVEESIDELIGEAVRSGVLRATTDANQAVLETEMSLVSVATPATAGYQPDLSAVGRVMQDIGQALRRNSGHHTVVLRSTVPPGTTESFVLPALEQASDRKVGDGLSLVFNPEFLREGSSVRDFRAPPQTVVGCLDDAGHDAMRGLYGALPGPWVRTSPRVAEAVKYLCNVFHALKIVFANEAGSVLKAQGVDAREVMRVFCQDTQLNISPAYLRPGFAFGGSCLPKEVKGFVSLARSLNVRIPALAGLIDSNDTHVDRAFELIASGGRRPVALFGLAFKPGTDDLRDSPLVALAERLIGRGYPLTIYDPNVKLSRLLGKNREYIEREIPHLERMLLDDAHAALTSAEVVVVGHADASARQAIAAHARGRRIVDLAGYADLQALGDARYEGICW